MGKGRGGTSFRARYLERSVGTLSLEAVVVGGTGARRLPFALSLGGCAGTEGSAAASDAGRVALTAGSLDASAAVDAPDLRWPVLIEEPLVA